MEILKFLQPLCQTLREGLESSKPPRAEELLLFSFQSRRHPLTLTTPRDVSAVAPVIITVPATSYLQWKFLGRSNSVSSPPEGLALKEYWEIGAPASASGNVHLVSGPGTRSSVLLALKSLLPMPYHASHQVSSKTSPSQWVPGFCLHVAAFLPTPHPVPLPSPGFQQSPAAELDTNLWW